MELQDRHVVVTGAGRGIGAALARRFHAGGARVSLADLQGAEEVAAELGERAVGFTVDVSTEEGNVRLIEQAEAAFGRIDLFFANAGIGGGTDLESTSEEAWQKAYDVNVNAHRWAAKHLLPGWLAAGEGYFCSTASAAPPAAAGSRMSDTTASPLSKGTARAPVARSASIGTFSDENTAVLPLLATAISRASSRT